MNLNIIGYYWNYDGYGRLTSRLVKALQGEGVRVKPMTGDSTGMPSWMLEQEGISWDNLSISVLHTKYMYKIPGRHWLYTMTEGSLVEAKWIEKIHRAGIERVIVPCEHNREAFLRSGLDTPINVLHAGTDPEEFPLKTWDDEFKPFTFLTFADRGFRKGWNEVWEAFYAAFGGKTMGLQNVRLRVKARSGDEPHLLKIMRQAEGRDARIIYDLSDAESMNPIYESADCLALPSRSEGWGMPHREVAMMGIPVITQRYSGLDDGHLDEWAIALDGGHVAPIDEAGAGECMVADIGELAGAMRWCYENREESRQFAQNGARWLRENQTWSDMARKLVQLVEEDPCQ